MKKFNFNEEMEDVIKKVKFVEESDFLIKGASEATEDEVKQKKGGFISM